MSNFCSSLDGIWTHTIDTLQHQSLSLTSSALDHSTTSTPYIYIRLKINPNSISVRIRSLSWHIFVLPLTGFELQHQSLSLMSSALDHLATSAIYIFFHFISLQKLSNSCLGSTIIMKLKKMKLNLNPTDIQQFQTLLKEAFNKTQDSWLTH